MDARCAGSRCAELIVTEYAASTSRLNSIGRCRSGSSTAGRAEPCQPVSRSPPQYGRRPREIVPPGSPPSADTLGSITGSRPYRGCCAHPHHAVLGGCLPERPLHGAIHPTADASQCPRPAGRAFYNGDIKIKCVSRQTTRRSIWQRSCAMDDLLQYIDLDYYRSAQLLIARAEIAQLRGNHRQRRADPRCNILPQRPARWTPLMTAAP